MNGFTQVLNDLITDKRIGATAFRVAAYLGSKTEDWIPREHDVCEILGIGRDAYRTALRQLDDFGYLARGATGRDARTGRITSEPPTLRRPRTVAGRAQDGNPVTGTRMSDVGRVTQYGEHNTDTTTPVGEKAEAGLPANAPDSSPRASEGASAPERHDSSCQGCGMGYPQVPAELLNGWIGWHDTSGECARRQAKRERVA